MPLFSLEQFLLLWFRRFFRRFLFGPGEQFADRFVRDLLRRLTGVFGGGSKEGLYKTTDDSITYYIQLNSGGEATLYEFGESPPVQT